MNNFFTGLKNEILGQETVGGVSKFNIENLAGTVVHVAAGFIPTFFIRKKMGKKPVLNLSKAFSKKANKDARAEATNEASQRE